MSIIQKSDTVSIGSPKFSVINHDVVNLSTAQAKFSFGKGRRFSTLKPTVETEFSITLGSTMANKKSPSFGVGDRFKRQRRTSKLIKIFYHNSWLLE
jgi:hypothetical protein